MEQKKNRLVNESRYTDRESGTYAGLWLSLRRYRNRLEFYRGVKLNAKPREMDCLIIDKKDDTEPMDNDIARIFAKHNIVELKNPFEPLTVDTIWKVISYAAQYKSSGEKANEIKTEEVTITILRAAKPRKALKMLKDSGYKVENMLPGIYYITGMADFKTQIVVSSELKGDEYVSLRVQRRGADGNDIQLFQNAIGREYTSDEKGYAELVLKYGMYNKIDNLRGDNSMKTTYEQLLELHKEEDNRKTENSATALLKEGVSIETVAKCLELPKKRVKELAKSLTVTVG